MPRPDRYDSLSHAVNDLQQRGFTLDFNLLENGVKDTQSGRHLSPDDFHIVEFYRFEGQSDPADMSIVYAIEGPEGMKGVLVNAYGTYGSSLTTKLVEKLSVAHPQTPVGYEQPHADTDTGNIPGTAGHQKYNSEDVGGSNDGPVGGTDSEKVYEGRR